MTAREALKELTLKKLINHCTKQCAIHKDSKLGYEHYIFLQLLNNSYPRDIEDMVIDYSLIIEGKL